MLQTPKALLVIAYESPGVRVGFFRTTDDAGSFVQIVPPMPRIALAVTGSAPYHRLVSWSMRRQATAKGLA